MDNLEDAYTFDGMIESVSDILDITNRPSVYLSQILDDDAPGSCVPLGRNHHGAPRPYPHGIWFRGQSKHTHTPIPSVFREPRAGCVYDERAMFTDIRLRASNIDLRGFNNVELMCLMQHHSLPTRLMDWTESPLIAALFATSKFYYEKLEKSAEHKFQDMEVTDDAAIYVINAYRLNSYTNLSEHVDANIFNPKEIDVVLRSIMAEHTYLESVLSKIVEARDVVSDHASGLFMDTIQNIRNKLLGKSLNSQEDLAKHDVFLKRLSAPVAVMPRRSHARMDVQLSCFTIHGGKKYFDLDADGTFPHRDWRFMQPPLHLHEINGIGPQFDSLNVPLSSREKGGSKPFMLKFKISRRAVSRIMVELDRLGINDAMIYPDIQNQSEHAKRRWTADPNKTIFSLPPLSSQLIDPLNGQSRKPAGKSDYMGKLYGR